MPEVRRRSPPVAPGPVIAWLDLPPADTNGSPLKLILLVQPEAGRNGIVAMQDCDRDFPAGSLRFLNLCDFDLSLEAGGSATAVAAKGTVVIHVPVRADVGLPGYSWWDVPVSATSKLPGVRAASQAYARAIKQQNFYY